MSATPRAPASVLVACIGNLFLGDDGFGCEVARRLFARPLPEGVRVVDFGIRGIDLAYALLAPYAAAILVDATSRGGAPGTLYVIDPSPAAGLPAPASADAPVAHGLHPARAIALAQSMGPVIAELRLVGCEPETLGDEDEPLMELSPPVAAAVERAVVLIEALIAELRGAAPAHAPPGHRSREHEPPDHCARDRPRGGRDA